MKKNLIFALLIFAFSCNKKSIETDYSTNFIGTYEQILNEDNFSQYGILSILKSKTSSISLIFDFNTSYYENGLHKNNYNFEVRDIKLNSENEFSTINTITINNITDKTSEKVQIEIKGLLIDKKLTLNFIDINNKESDKWIFIKK